MGLFKFKCNSRPIMASVYDNECGEIVVFTTFNQLYQFYCDVHVDIPTAAKDAFNVYFESKRWHEHGCYDDRGVMRDNRCISFNDTRGTYPSEDEPGKISVFCLNA
jgi:hypothetical protein